MSVEKATEFLKYLAENEDVLEKFSGFTMEDLKQAAKAMMEKGEVSEEMLRTMCYPEGCYDI